LKELKSGGDKILNEEAREEFFLLIDFVIHDTGIGIEEV